MGYSYKQLVKLFGKEKADQIFESSGISKGKQEMFEEEKKNKEYIKLTEEAHGKILHKYLDEIGISHSHVGNEAGQSGSKNIIMMMAKKKALGVSKGYPDYFIYIPFKEGFITLVIELKKAQGIQGGWNGSIFKIEQAEWLNILSKIPFTWVGLCQGSKEAIELVNLLVKKIKNKSLKQVLDIWNNRELIDFTSKVNG